MQRIREDGQVPPESQQSEGPDHVPQDREAQAGQGEHAAEAVHQEVPHGARPQGKQGEAPEHEAAVGDAED